MKARKIEAMYLNLAEREAQEGKRAWTALDYIIVGEISSRRTFIDRTDSGLLAAARGMGLQWGEKFCFDAEIGQRGEVTFTALYPFDDGEGETVDVFE